MKIEVTLTPEEIEEICIAHLERTISFEQPNNWIKMRGHIEYGGVTFRYEEEEKEEINQKQISPEALICKQAPVEENYPRMLNTKELREELLKIAKENLDEGKSLV